MGLLAVRSASAYQYTMVVPACHRMVVNIYIFAITYAHLCFNAKTTMTMGIMPLAV